MQVDDDSYVRIDMLLERMRAAPNSYLFMGAVENPGGGPHRNPKSPWFVTEEEWPGTTYPPWAHGAGYVISQVQASCKRCFLKTLKLTPSKFEAMR